MNYLAHMLLADDTPHSLIGNLAGDFVRGADLSAMPAEMRRGIELHRAVDRFTDTHPLVRRSRARLPAGWRHYRGVLIDVFYDHFLARQFDRYAGHPLNAFAERVYAALVEHHEVLPPRLQQAAPVMIERDWLRAYAEVEGVAAVLKGMSRRARRKVALDQSTQTLRSQYDALRDDFEGFFPELVRFAERRSA